MFDEFIKRKLNSILEKFIQNSSSDIKINKWEGIIQKYNLNLKTQLIQNYISYYIGLPLNLIGARINKLAIQIPWSSLLKQQTKVVIDGIYIYATTTDKFVPEYYNRIRHDYLEEFIRKYTKIDQHNEIQTKKQGYLKRIKDFIFGKISLQIKNIYICIQNQFSTQFRIGLSCDSVSFSNIFDQDGHKFSLILANIGAHVIPSIYKLNKQQRFQYFLKNIQQQKKTTQYCIKPTTVVFQRITNLKQSEKIKNLIFNDIKLKLDNQINLIIKYILKLFHWHNSVSKNCYLRPDFTQTPLNAPKRWWLYVQKLITNFLKQAKYRKKYYYLRYRREYINNYKSFHKGKVLINKLGPNNNFMKLAQYNIIADKLIQMEQKLQVFEIIEYRKYAILFVQKNKQIQLLLSTIKKKNQQGWFSAFFGNRDNQKQLQQFEQLTHLNQPQIVNLSEFNLIINKLEAKINTKVYKREDSFITVNINNIEWKLSEQKQQIKNVLQIGEIWAQYDEYLGYEDSYKYLFKKRNLSNLKDENQQDQFEDFEQKFLIISTAQSNSQEKTRITLQPFIIILNDQVIDKFALFIDQKYKISFGTTLEKTSSVVFHQLVSKLKLNTLKQFVVQFSAQLLIPQSMYQLSNDMLLRIDDNLITVKKQTSNIFNYTFNMKNISLINRYINNNQSINDSNYYIQRYLIDTFSIKLKMCLTVNIQSFLIKSSGNISRLKLKIQNRQLDQILYFFNRYKRFFKKKKKKTVISKRKPSLGQEYMDAVENITDHLYKSVHNQKKKQKKNILANTDMKKIMDQILQTVLFQVYLQKIEILLFQERNIYTSISLDRFQFSMIKESCQNFSIIQPIRMKIYLQKIELVINQYLNLLKSIKKKQLINLQQYVDPQGLSKQEHILIEYKKNFKTPIILTFQNPNTTVQFFCRDKQYFMFQNKLNLNYQSNDIKIDSKTALYIKNDAINQYQYIFQPFITQINIINTFNKVQTNFSFDNVNININKNLIIKILDICKYFYEQKNTHKLLNKLIIPIKISNGSNGYRQIQSNREIQLQDNINKDIYIIFGQKKFLFNFQQKLQNHILLQEQLQVIKRTTFHQDFTQNIIKSNFSIVNDLNGMIDLTFYHLNKNTTELKKISHLFIRPNQKIYLLQNNLQELYMGIKIHNQQELFDNICLKKIKQQGQQILITSLNFYLILYLQIIPSFEHSINKYIIHISCPVEVINFLPSPISLKFSKQSLDLQSISQPLKPLKSMKRKRSFQILNLQKINPAQSYSFHNLTIQDINQIYVVFQQHSQRFKLDLQHDLQQNYIKTQRQSQKNQPYQRQNLETSQTTDYEVNKIIALYSQANQINILCRIFVKKKSVKISFMSEYIIFNLLDYQLNLKVKQCDYFYNKIQICRKSLQDQFFDPQQFKLDSYNNRELIRQIFKKYRKNLALFTGLQTPQSRQIYLNQNLEAIQDDFSQSLIKIIINNQIVTAFVRKIQLNFGFIFIFICPICSIINKTKQNVLIRSRSQQKIIKNQQKVAITIFDNQSIFLSIHPKNQIVDRNLLINQFKIDINNFGISYYRKFIKKQDKKFIYKFYRILLAKSQYSINILIQQSQYPPITFINKTKYKIRVHQQKNSLGEVIDIGNQLQYALKDINSSGIFTLYFEKQSQFRLLCLLKLNTNNEQFEQQRNKVKFYIKIQTFKDKKIVFLSSQNIQQNKNFESLIEDRIQNSRQFKIGFNKIGISLQSSIFRQSFYLQYQNLNFIMKLKNRITSIKLYCHNIKAFNYSNLIPSKCFTFQKQKHNIIESIHQFQKSIFKKKNQSSEQFKKDNCFVVNILYNFHEDIKIIKQAHIFFEPINCTVDSKMIIDHIKNFSDLWGYFQKIFQILRSRHKIKANDEIQKTYIVENIKIQQCNINVFFQNLPTLQQLYKHSTFYSLIINILKDIGKLKPLKLQKFDLYYQKISLKNIVKIMNFSGKIKQIISQIMLKPAIQLHNILLTLLGFSTNEETSIIKNSISATFYFLKTILKSILKGRKISGINPSQINQSDIFSVIKDMKFWKIQEQEMINWNRWQQKEISYGLCERFERFMDGKIVRYEYEWALIKFGLDLFNGNKCRRQILCVFRVSKVDIIGLTYQKLIIVEQQKRRMKILNLHEIIDLRIVNEDLQVKRVRYSKKKSLKSLNFEIIRIQNCLKQFKVKQFQRLKQLINIQTSKQDKFYFNYY